MSDIQQVIGGLAGGYARYLGGQIQGKQDVLERQLAEQDRQFQMEYRQSEIDRRKQEIEESKKRLELDALKLKYEPFNRILQTAQGGHGEQADAMLKGYSGEVPPEWAGLTPDKSFVPPDRSTPYQTAQIANWKSDNARADMARLETSLKSTASQYRGTPETWLRDTLPVRTAHWRSSVRAGNPDMTDEQVQAVPMPADYMNLSSMTAYQAGQLAETGLNRQSRESIAEANRLSREAISEAGRTSREAISAMKGVRSSGGGGGGTASATGRGKKIPPDIKLNSADRSQAGRVGFNADAMTNSRVAIMNFLGDMSNFDTDDKGRKVGLTITGKNRRDQINATASGKKTPEASITNIRSFIIEKAGRSGYDQLYLQVKMERKTTPLHQIGKELRKGFADIGLSKSEAQQATDYLLRNAK